jgi:hypothetical protein
MLSKQKDFGGAMLILGKRSPTGINRKAMTSYDRIALIRSASVGKIVLAMLLQLFNGYVPFTR